MPFDLKNLNPVARCHWSEDEWVEFREAPVGKMQEWREKVAKEKVEYRRGVRHSYNVVDDKKLSELIWDYQIANWQLKEPDGTDIPCNLDNKMLLVNGSPDFMKWALDCLERLSDDNARIQEEQEKNLPNG